MYAKKLPRSLELKKDLKRLQGYWIEGYVKDMLGDPNEQVVIF